jgi:hypothetical protein
VFQRVPCALTALPNAQDEARFTHFKSTVLPVLLSGLNGTCQPHTALFIPSYYDYVRVRNELLRREQVCDSHVQPIEVQFEIYHVLERIETVHCR